MADDPHLPDSATDASPHAAAELLPLVYAELRQLAAARVAGQAPEFSLDATALVHEAYLKLAGPGGDKQWADRGHFFAAAAEAMRHILVDRARRPPRGSLPPRAGGVGHHRQPAAGHR